MSIREEQLLRDLADVLGVHQDSLSATALFAELGVDSVLGLRFARAVQDHVAVEVELEWLFDYPSVRQLAQFLDRKFGPLQVSGSVHS